MNREQRKALRERIARDNEAKANGGVAVAERPTPAEPKPRLEKPPKAERPPKPPPDPSKPPTKVVYLCGHTNANIPCGRCREKSRRQAAEKRRAKQDAKRAAGIAQPASDVAGRLPDGSTFTSLIYSAERVMWTGTLVVPNLGSFSGENSSVRRLCDDLGRRCWEELHKGEAEGNLETAVADGAPPG